MGQELRWSEDGQSWWNGTEWIARADAPASAWKTDGQATNSHEDAVTRTAVEIPRQVVFDRQDQLKQIQSGLMTGEVLFAVYDGKGAGTGFLAVTDKRVIIQDKSYVGKKIAMISMPFNRIADVGVLSNQSIFGNFFSTSEILIRTLGGDRHEIEFRGTDKARYVHDLILHYITNQR